MSSGKNCKEKLDITCTEWTVSQSHLARILGVSHQRVNQLIEEKVVERDELSKSGGVLLIQSLKNYWRSKAPEKDKNEDGTVVFWKERALLTRRQRELAELKLSKARGELYNAAEVEDAFVQLVITLRTNLLGLPNKFAVQLEGKTRAQIAKILTEEIEYQLTELSNFDVSTLATAPAEIEEDES